ncbi:hypothetical protein TPA0910_14180 [Streptomyces hygroscopicus subsp. sporocinereus]|uniref:Integral membrane protein n=1 Tax=Streptomyces hygroscopicus TaxID=1912 RepID=A0ABQ3TUI6_STRHY|nr:hypothetical protein TPA0910_14180 [Streptomyces hygroscopicus]
MGLPTRRNAPRDGERATRGRHRSQRNRLAGAFPVIQRIRYRVMTTCGIAGPVLLLSIGFGLAVILGAAWTTGAP